MLGLLHPPPGIFSAEDTDSSAMDKSYFNLERHDPHSYAHMPRCESSSRVHVSISRRRPVEVLPTPYRAEHPRVGLSGSRAESLLVCRRSVLRELASVSGSAAILRAVPPQPFGMHLALVKQICERARFQDSKCCSLFIAQEHSIRPSGFQDCSVNLTDDPTGGWEMSDE